MRGSRLLLVIGLGAVVTASAAAMHNRLTDSRPKADAVVATAPTVIQLWFAENPEPALSSIALVAADGRKIPVAKPEKTDDPLSIRATVGARLAPGVYTVQWRASGKDGHVIRGSYRFTVKP